MAVLIVMAFAGWLVLLAIVAKQYESIKTLQRNAVTKEHFDMTVAGIKNLIASSKLEVLDAGVSETAELKLIIGNNAGGATPSQLDEIAADIEDFRDTAVDTITGLSDKVAGEEEPEPAPGPGPGPTA